MVVPTWNSSTQGGLVVQRAWATSSVEVREGCSETLSQNSKVKAEDVTQMLECLPSMPSPARPKPGVVVHACDPRAQTAEAGGSSVSSSTMYGVQGQPTICKTVFKKKKKISVSGANIHKEANVKLRWNLSLQGSHISQYVH